VLGCSSTSHQNKKGMWPEDSLESVGATENPARSSSSRDGFDKGASRSHREKALIDDDGEREAA